MVSCALKYLFYQNQIQNNKFVQLNRSYMITTQVNKAFQRCWYFLSDNFSMIFHRKSTSSKIQIFDLILWHFTPATLNGRHFKTKHIVVSFVVQILDVFNIDVYNVSKCFQNLLFRYRPTFLYSNTQSDGECWLNREECFYLMVKKYEHFLFYRSFFVKCCFD